MLSCGTEQSSLDVCSAYFGTGSKDNNRNKPLLWAWACEVQSVVSHSEDWTNATVKVHWYRLAPNAKKRWVCAFWDPQNKYTAAGKPKLVWDVPNPDDPQYWYMEEYSITIGQVIVAFEGFDIDNNGKETDQAGNILRDARGKAIKTAVYKLTQNLQDHCETECRARNEAYCMSRANSTPGPGLATSTRPQSCTSGGSAAHAAETGATTTRACNSGSISPSTSPQAAGHGTPAAVPVPLPPGAVAPLTGTRPVQRIKARGTGRPAEAGSNSDGHVQKRRRRA